MPALIREQVSYLSHLECARCSRAYDCHAPHGMCECGAPLFCRYDLARIAKDVERADVVGRSASLWRYHELLPVDDVANAVTLGEGFTPLLPLKWGADRGFPLTWLKDEGQNPTGSFKARGAAVSVTRLRELGVGEVVVSSSGNAGDAWAVYTKRGGIKATIILPDDTPAATLVESSLTGQSLYTFGGHNARGGKLANDFASSHGVYNANTFREPYRAEGKKTMGLEIAEQLGWQMPEVIVYPIGGGVGLVGIWKAFLELRELGWITGELPRFVVAQYDGCAPLAQAFAAGKNTCEPWPEITTPPGGLRAPKPLADFVILDILRASKGTAIAVSAEQALAAVRSVMQSDGIFTCPEAGTAVAALDQLLASGWIQADERVVVVNTGSGLKYAPLFSDAATRIADDVVEI